MSTCKVMPESLRPQAELSLPPDVTGPVEGESLLHISGLKLVDGPHEGQTLQIRVQWWGDTGAGTLLHIKSGLGTTAARFPIRCSAGHFQQYLQDMEWLALALEDRFSGMLGEAALAVGELTEQRPLAGAISFVQWLGSGENKLVATAQLKLLLSFTPIPVPELQSTGDVSAASDTGYHSSCSSSSSQDSLSSNGESSAMMPGKLETAQEIPDSRESPHAEPGRAPQLPAFRQPGQARTGSLKRQQQQHATQPQGHLSLAAEPTATLDSRASRDSATPPQAADMALRDEYEAVAEGVAEGSRQNRPLSAATMTGEGKTPGPSPEEALSRLIQRAEQLRQMITCTAADSLPAMPAPAKTGTGALQYCIAPDGDVLSIHAAKHEGLRVETSLPAMLSANSGKEHTQHSSTAAGKDTVKCDSESGNVIGDSAKQTQLSISMGTAPVTGKQKGVREWALPVSKLRRVVEGKSGIVGRERALGPQRTITSSLLQDFVAATGAPRPGHSRRPHKDAACQTTPGLVLSAPRASQLSKSASQNSLPTADAPLGRPAPSSAAQVQALRKSLRQPQQAQGKLFQRQTSQEGLLRSHSAPALNGDTIPLLTTSEESQPSAQTHRDAGQHGAPDTPVADTQHSSRGSGKSRKRAQPSSRPKAPSIDERQAWCNTFNPSRQRPAGQKPRENRNLARSSASGSVQQAPGLQAPFPPEQGAQLLTASAGFCGQPARATVQILSASVPSTNSPLRDDPTYSVMYRLPGDPALQLTPGMEAEASADAASSGKALRLTINHATSHWVTADERLAQRLLSTPMLATVLLHPSAKKGDLSPQPVPVGTAEIDLATLLVPRLSSVRAALRAVMGTYPLIHPGAQSLYGACITIKVSLDLDPPNAQEASPELQGATMPQTATATPAAAALQDLGQDALQGDVEGQTSLSSLSRSQRARAGVHRQGGWRPATAETSTEYFARMEACSAQPASTNGHPSKSDSSLNGQQEDLLAAWRQLSAIDSVPQGPGSLENAYISPPLPDAGLAASWNHPEQSPLQAPLADDLNADAYTSAAWGISDSPSMLMGSPDQYSQQQLPFSDSASAWQSSQFPESPEQLPLYPTWSPMLEQAAELASQPFNSSIGQLSAGLQFLEAIPALLESSLELQLRVETGVSEQGLGQPSEEDLYTMLARFQENCSQLPAEDSDGHADLAALSPPSSQTQHAEQQDAAKPHDVEHKPCPNEDTGEHTPPQQEVAAVADHLTAASEAEQESSLRPAMYMDCLEPDEAAHMPLTEDALRSECLATCSDDENFAVLDFGGASDGSSECSFGAEGAAASHKDVYSAPRGALIMPGALGASDDWLFGISATVPESCPSVPHALEVQGLSLGALGFGFGSGHSLKRPGLAASTCMASASGEGLAQAVQQGGFSFTNILPPVPTDHVTEQDDWSSERSLLQSFSAASSPKPEQATDIGCQPNRGIDASGNGPHARAVAEQPVSTSAAEDAEPSAQHDLDFDIDCLLLSSISLCSPSSCQPPPFLGATQLTEPAVLDEQQPESREEAASVSLPIQKPAQPEHTTAGAVFMNVLSQPDRQSTAADNSLRSSSADDVSEQQPLSDSPDRQAAFSNVLPCLDEQPSMHNSGSDSISGAANELEQQPSAQPPGMSRREVFRQKLAAAQAARLGGTGQPSPASFSPEPTGFGAEQKYGGSPSTEEDRSSGSLSPLQEAPLHAAEADAHHSIDENSEPAQATDVPGTSPSSALASGGSQTHAPAGDGISASTADEESSIASSEPEQAPLSIERHADKAVDGSGAGMQWADNAAAGESNGDHEEPSDVAIRRMSTMARQSMQAPAPQQPTILRDAAVAHTIGKLHHTGEKADNADEAQSSLTGSGNSASGVERKPIEAGVHWADNAASVGAVAANADAPDEALLHAIRRMSAVAREHALSSLPMAETPLSTDWLEHTNNTTASKLQQRTQQQIGPKAGSPLLPELQDHAYGAVSPVSISEQGSVKSGQGTLPTSVLGSPTSFEHAVHARQPFSTPVRASYEQLLARFKGSPVPERCYTPPPCSSAQVTEQDTGCEAEQPSAAEDAVTRFGQASGQLGSPQWQHRSPLPICSPAHAYVAGQTSPPGALGARLRDLEPKQVLPALRALWGNDRKCPPKADMLARAGETASDLGESRGSRKGLSGAVKAAVADRETALRMTLTMTKDNGVESQRNTRPAAKRGSFDPEAERIAEIMASVRASPWQHRQDNSQQD